MADQCAPDTGLRIVSLKACRDRGVYTGLQGAKPTFSFASAVRAAKRNAALRSFREAQARAQLKGRIDEGEIYLKSSELLARHPDVVERWVKRTIGTLGRVFSSQPNAQDFEKLVQSENVPTFTDPVGSGVEYLRSIDEELLILQHAPGPPKTGAKPVGKKIFIGHGRSPVWRELKDFIQDRLHLTPDEFNREPAAGMTTSDRLRQMLDDARFAFLVMTAEDGQQDGTFRARENVVHEVGLFQGRLGFMRAIILLEEGCETFSNIYGLTVLEFPKDHINTKFEEIRQTLEREGILPTGGSVRKRGA